jgi:hypothetical protein
MTSLRRNNMRMLSGTVRAMLMLCVTIKIVQSIWALISMSNWDRYAVWTGPDPSPARHTG